MSIDVRDVFHLYPATGGMVPALRGLSLSVAAGEVCVVRGPNGSGKSTLVEILSGALTPLSGQVRVAGSLRTLRQHDNVLGELTVSEFLALAQADVEQLINEWSFADIADSRLVEVSSGTRQLVAAASVLASRPAVLLADEPAATLSPHETWMLYRRITNHCREHNVTLILVTHDKTAEEFADRIVRINDGRISEQWLPGQDEQTLIDRHGWLRLPRDHKVVVPAAVSIVANDDALSVTGLVQIPTEMKAERLQSASSDVVVSLKSAVLPYGIGDQSGGVNLQVTQGSFVVVTGPSGSGKSTLLRAMVGVESLASGEISIADSHSLFAEHVGASLSAREAGASDQWIERLGLTEFADRPMRSLSGGQRQKALLAIALSSETEVLILDDPTSALDEENRELVKQILRTETDRTLIVASNDEQLIAVADLVITVM
mgnify:FL=1